MSNREIEDVLSSIRRLVTQGDGAEAAVSPARGKLVLTPAFRVADPQPAAASPAPREPEPAPESAPVASGSTALSLEQTIAELEAAIATYGGPFEPDEGDAALQETFDVPELGQAEPEPARAERAEPAATGLSSAAEPVRTPEPPQAVAQPSPEPDVDAPVLDEDDDAAEMVFDEAMLRELVTDILREELQGALGQRITRNVRKLVRSEIARALASRDLG
jgi:hypothetical protein